jgi:hypothetical protein
MQQRRFRPGDVLDDYCPRERRITDHAIVAMIDDRIKQTRCVVCDAEHEYKEGKVPVQRRKRPQAALFSQVLDGLQGPQPAARLSHHVDPEAEHAPGPVDDESIAPIAAMPSSDNGHRAAAARHVAIPPPVITEAPPPLPATLAAAQPVPPAVPDPSAPRSEEGSVRRPLIRATLPRPEGQPVATRSMPEFTIRQPTNNRGGHRPGGRRHGGGHPQGQGSPGPMRFGRGSHGQGHGQGQGQGQRQQQGGRPHRPGGGRPGPRRGGKKP